jgi:hypothetical protein
VVAGVAAVAVAVVAVAVAAAAGTVAAVAVAVAAGTVAVAAVAVAAGTAVALAGADPAGADPAGLAGALRLLPVSLASAFDIGTASARGDVDRTRVIEAYSSPIALHRTQAALPMIPALTCGPPQPNRSSRRSHVAASPSKKSANSETHH